MKTVLLAGGFGTRIRDVAADIPKPMIPIGPYPVLLHIMKHYGAAGFRKFIIALGHQGDVIRQYFLNYRSNTHDMTISLGEKSKIVYHDNHSGPVEDWEVTLAETGLNSMTGTRISLIRRYIAPDDTFMLTYGDGVGNVAIKDLVEFHRSHGKILTITGVRPPGRFGELSIEDETRVVGFNEKPQVSGGLISGGFFVCSTRIFDYLDERADLVFESEPMKRLTADNQVRVFRHPGFWHPMDTHRDFVLLNDLWNKGAAPWKTW